MLKIRIDWFYSLKDFEGHLAAKDFARNITLAFVYSFSKLVGIKCKFSRSPGIWSRVEIQ